MNLKKSVREIKSALRAYFKQKEKGNKNEKNNAVYSLIPSIPVDSIHHKVF